MNLTLPEKTALLEATNLNEFNTAWQKVIDARGGKFPADWREQVLMSDLMARSVDSWGSWLSKQDLLSDEWKVLVTDEQIIAVWEEDARIREKTGQPAQAALLRDCIKTLRTRLLP